MQRGLRSFSLLCAMVCTSNAFALPAEATVDVNAVSPTLLLGALSHCLPQFDEAMKGAHSVGQVTQSTPPVPESEATVSVWSITTVRGGLFPHLGGLKENATLVITETIFAANDAAPDRAKKVSYICELTKK